MQASGAIIVSLMAGTPRGIGGQVSKTSRPGAWSPLSRTTNGDGRVTWHRDLPFCRPDPWSPRRPGTAKGQFADL